MPRQRSNKPGQRGGVVALATAILLLCCCCCATPAFAKVKLDVEIGWQDKFRAGRWSPVFVTLEDSAPRQVVVEVYTPADRRYALNIKQSLAIGPQPVTVPIYVPLSYQLDETSVTVRDANSGRRLEHLILNDFPIYANQSGPQIISPQTLFVLISGSSNGQSLLQSQLQHHQIVATSYVAPNRLPVVAEGYDGVDLLLLNQPELARLNVDQQSAIATWVRAGGLLVIVPGVAPVPPTGPIAEILPARPGEVRQLDLDPSAVDRAGLPARFAKLTARDLVDARSGARAVPLFGAAGPEALRHWVGLGQVMLLPVDVSTLLFDDPNRAIEFWRAAMKGVADIPATADTNGTVYYYGSSDDPRRAAAVRRTLDWVGEVPGAGSFGFSYVAIVLLAMMLIVGPVDWFVLKWTGKQPWTWVTISGWIGLVTLGSIYIGHVFKSGEVHYRTASLIDEAAGARVAAFDLVGLYSPRTTVYDFEFTPHSWWRTASLNFTGPSDLQTEIPCHQDYRGSRPLPMLINVWNMRFLEGEQLGDEPPMVQAHLTRDPARQRITGSIISRAAVPLTDILVRTRDGVAKLSGTLAPGATIPVDAELTAADPALFATTQMTQQDQWQYYQQELATTRPTAQTINQVADRRALRIDQQLADRDDLACVYATFSAPPAERVRVNDLDAPRTEHIGIVRALVPLQSPQMEGRR